MRILIIGGTGIISTGVSRLLIDRGDEVVLYNRGQRLSQVEAITPRLPVFGKRLDR